MIRPQTPVAVPFAARMIPAVFGFVFAGIGLTVIGFLWLTPFDDFGSPPLFFRIFGSFIAIAFVALGGTMGLAAVAGRADWVARKPPASAAPGPMSPAAAAAGTPSAAGRYACPHCGAAMTGGTEASPHGDVKCPHCGAWFNVHGR